MRTYLGCMRTYIRTYLRTYVRTYLRTYVGTYVRTFYVITYKARRSKVEEAAGARATSKIFEMRHCSVSVL